MYCKACFGRGFYLGVGNAVILCRCDAASRLGKLLALMASGEPLPIDITGNLTTKAKKT